MANENRNKKNYEEASPEPVHPRGILGHPLLQLSITLHPQCSFHHEGMVWMVLAVLPRASWLLSEGLTLRFCSPRQQRNPCSQNTWLMVIAPPHRLCVYHNQDWQPFFLHLLHLDVSAGSSESQGLPLPLTSLQASTLLLLKPKSSSIQTVFPQTLKVLPPTLASPLLPPS